MNGKRFNRFYVLYIAHTLRRQKIVSPYNSKSNISMTVMSAQPKLYVRKIKLHLVIVDRDRWIDNVPSCMWLRSRSNHIAS